LTVIKEFAPSGVAEDFPLGIDLRGLGWAYSFAGVLTSALDRTLREAHLEIGKALDRRPLPGSQQSLPVVIRPGRRPDTTVEEPRIVWEDEEGGLAVLFKPPGWEVDDDTSVPTGRKLSEYLQGRYPQSCISRDAHHCHGIIHRLDLPSSGLILVGTSFEGYYRLKWQLDTAQIVREYAVVCHGWANPLLREIDVPVYHVAAGSAAESAQPGQKHGDRDGQASQDAPASPRAPVSRRGAIFFARDPNLHRPTAPDSNSPPACRPSYGV